MSAGSCTQVTLRDALRPPPGDSDCLLTPDAAEPFPLPFGGKPKSSATAWCKRPGRQLPSLTPSSGQPPPVLARVVECGCKLPDVATAWLYVDRASLDEGTEVSLLASGGNKYQLVQLQQAAIILDRSMRKPWEKSGKTDGARRPHTVHHAEDAEYPDEKESDEEPPERGRARAGWRGAVRCLHDGQGPVQGHHPRPGH